MAGSPPDSSHSRHAESPIDFVPQRVVSLVPSLTESLFDLDLGNRLIAITDYCVRPPDGVKSIIQVGGTKNPNIEQIIVLEPDLVLMNNDENRREDAETLRAAGVAVWATHPRSVFDALNVLWDIMDVFDHAVMVPRVREIERAYDYTLAASRTAVPVRVFAPIWRDPWLAFNADTYTHDVLRVCGGANVFAGHDERYPRITLEQVIEAQPEIVLLPDEPYAFTGADINTFRALDIPAAHNSRIVTISGSLLTWHGTRVAYALRDLPPLLAGGNSTT
ncbi:MAG: ABC transporter substrate-binding protein [Anaerolineae bacterium]|nr:ABC transporter substrate-binding protein [Anaerolineae bacterium]